jgi:hypothetical protein
MNMSTKNNTLNPAQLVSRLISAEVDPEQSPAGRRVLGDERLALSSALQSKDPSRIARSFAEATRVAKMWGVIE